MCRRVGWWSSFCPTELCVAVMLNCNVIQTFLELSRKCSDVNEHSRSNFFWKYCVHRYQACKEILPQVFCVFGAHKNITFEITFTVENIKDTFLVYVHEIHGDFQIEYDLTRRKSCTDSVWWYWIWCTRLTGFVYIFKYFLELLVGFLRTSSFHDSEYFFGRICA